MTLWGRVQILRSLLAHFHQAAEQLPGLREREARAPCLEPVFGTLQSKANVAKGFLFYSIF